MRPEQHEKIAAIGRAGRPPFVVHRPEPPQRLQEPVAKCRFQPHEIFSVRRPPAPCGMVAPDRAAKGAPLPLGPGAFNALMHELPAGRSQGEVFALPNCCLTTIRTNSLAQHIAKTKSQSHQYNDGWALLSSHRRNGQVTSDAGLRSRAIRVAYCPVESCCKGAPGFNAERAQIRGGAEGLQNFGNRL
jgi:hypothetical protein